MSNRYIYPEQKFKVSLELEVNVSFVGMWGGISQDVFNERYQQMLKDGSFVELIKDKIMEDLQGETFDCNNPEPFDRLCFDVECL